MSALPMVIAGGQCTDYTKNGAKHGALRDTTVERMGLGLMRGYGDTLCPVGQVGRKPVMPWAQQAGIV